MKNYFHLILSAAFSGAVVLSFQACGGNQTEALQSQVDSLTATIEQQSQDLDFYQSCLFLISDGLDSIAKADDMTRQRERIGQLEQQIAQGGKERERLRGLIDMQNKQIEEKDAKIQKLQEKIETQGFNVSMLLDEVNKLNTKVASLKQENKAQSETIKAAQEMLNEAYYIVGSSKELKKAGVLSSKFLGKSKINADQIDASLFNQIDIRNFRQLNIPSKKITIKSQHPSSSYKITTDKKSDTTTLEILDEVEFWSLTRYLVIQD